MDETGPIPGAQILVKGTKKYTQADFDGKFEIQVVKGDTLIISYTGLKTKETRIKSKNYYKITLFPHVKLSRKTIRYYKRYAREHNGNIPEF
ncbi:MAG: carboxypeptidase-like regulatory domain-containing protein [Flavobacterium sp. JAD_PAG50586_2]|nr:MAG: carboxypeptidase-like regulatory domain-containing protein [Flavobacterium sp. JAD_PAG50586_2]